MSWLERMRERLGALGARWIGIARGALVALVECPLAQAAFSHLEALGRDG